MRTTTFVVLSVLTVAATRAAAGQIPGIPVLQNVWATPGIVGALDIGTGSGGSVYAAAGSWTPSSGRFEISGGAGYQRMGGNAGSRGVYGARAAIPFGGATSTFGFGAFAGIGGGPGRVVSTPDTVFTPGGTSVSVVDSTTSTFEIPVGVSVGWRHAIGATHGVSLYASPTYTFFSGGGGSGGLIRGAIGADFGVTSKLGATVGFEFGGTREQGFGGPTGTLFGLGLSYAFSHL